MNDKFNNPLEIQPEVYTSDTLLSCFATFLRRTRSELRREIIPHLPPDPRNDRDGYIGDIDDVARIVSSLYSVSIWINGRVVAGGAAAATVYLVNGDKGFQLMRIRGKSKANDDSPFLLDLWNHPEPGKAVELMTLTPPQTVGYGVHWGQMGNIGNDGSIGNGETVCTLFSIIPHDKLWRHVLTDPKDVLYVYIGTTLVATQAYHAKTNPYFYIDTNESIYALITKDGEKAAYALLCEFTSLVCTSI